MMESPGAPNRAKRRDPFSRKNRRLLYASDLSVLLSCAYAGWRYGHGWSWPLFAWAVGAALLVVIGSLFFGWVSRRDLTAAQRAQEVAALRGRAFPLYIPTLVYGPSVGIIAARWRSPWPDVFLTITALAAGFLLPFVLRRRQRTHASRAVDG
ncbi:MAG: hypothetical protein QOK06_2596 [Acidimicrobiaceae bacterium]|jgi:hypothetical protein|nr:hypothetical protein [Actinomycetota bacterium]